jgi:hypothetical protein
MTQWMQLAKTAVAELVRIRELLEAIRRDGAKL